MAGLSHYYGRAKSGLMNINPHEATQLGEDWLIAGATGMMLGLVSASIGGLEKDIAGFKVPVDGLFAFGLGAAGLAMRSPELRTASVAAGGSAATRTFEAFFKKALNAHGDFDSSDIPFGHDPHQLSAGGYAYGADDRLIEAARSL